MPPSRAIVMAVRASVTESIAALTSGMLSSMLRVRRVFTSTSFGQHLAVRGDEQDVVERQALAELVVEHGRAYSDAWVVDEPVR